MLVDIEYLVTSDIHLGRDNNDIVDIIRNFKEYFRRYHNKLKKLSLIFVDGDIYDKSLRHGSDEAILVTSLLTWLAEYCLDNNIVLRILEGTPSHDWKQVRAFNKIIKENDRFKELDFKYVEELYIEHLEKFGIDILYVPDEWRDSPSKTILEVHELLNAKGIDKVDLTMMHGNFKYQIPEFITEGHSEKDYLDITRHYIHIGHVHTFSVYDRILANGSFDRLAHGEEEDKGCIIATITCSGRREFIFLPNEHARIFDTINTVEMNLEDISALKKYIRKKYGVRKPLSLRLKGDTNELHKVHKDLSLSFPLITFKIDRIDKKCMHDINNVFNMKTAITEITPGNIYETVISNIKPSDMSPLLVDELKKVI